MGKWAIVTGASSGIGRALALEFAAGGFDMLLTGRNETALKEVASECSSKYGAECDIVIADLSRGESINLLAKVINSTAEERAYEVLVNNAGFGIHGAFDSTDVDQNVDLVNVQVTAALKLTNAVLPSMIARRSGRILNVGSVYSFAPVPNQSVYSACKAFLLSFSASLRNELTGTGVTVTVFCPGVTQTEFRRRAGIGEKNRKSGMSAAAAAHIAYVQTMRGGHVVVPGLVNRIFVFAAQLLGPSTMAPLVRFINRQRGLP